jgi:hypothetical protein
MSKEQLATLRLILGLGCMVGTVAVLLRIHDIVI